MPHLEITGNKRNKNLVPTYSDLFLLISYSPEVKFLACGAPSSQATAGLLSLPLSLAPLRSFSHSPIHSKPASHTPTYRLQAAINISSLSHIHGHRGSSQAAIP